MEKQAYLMAKLIAGHTQDNESAGGVTTVELVHLSVVPGCCSSERRHILNENNFPLQWRETEQLSRQQLSCQLVKPFHIPSHSRCIRMICTSKLLDLLKKNPETLRLVFIQAD